MNLRLLVLAFSLFQYLSFSQCPPDGIFTSQSEIDSFAVDYPNCTELNINSEVNFALTISGNDITDLSPLSNIASITGSLLSISIGDTSLQTLTGMENIETNAINLSIGNNPLLSDISALSNMTTDLELGTLVIGNNPLLNNLVGLNMSSCTEFFLENNNGLTDLDGLSNLNSASVFVVRNNET